MGKNKIHKVDSWACRCFSVCVCVCVCECVCVCVQVCVNVCLFVYESVWMFVCVGVRCVCV